ncbi:hypothetical protein EST38_g8347 [Candolleomyces aberdarensis]|uniref:Uncharacterized protein n=1 Tax=Candolleomyces aberdarensis TaxID=2316362 RepID=A0A4Q2DFK8_9AGAR|nr:hypothetical protein EST38_g8347 [Candolleomyces aberdarensis]
MDSTGRFLYQGGVRYYSPNSIRGVSLSVGPLEKDSSPFKPRGERRSEIRYDDLLKPRIWEKPFYWISFIATKHWYKRYHLPPLRHLLHLPEISLSTDCENPGYHIDAKNPFTQFENEIYRAVAALRNKFDLPCVLPFLPNALGYLSTFKIRAQLVHTLEETREWFSVWLGALSYCLVMADTRQVDTEGQRLGGYPSWRQVLREEGLTDAWIDEVVASPICQYSEINTRIGCVLEVIDSHPDQPNVEWFTNLGIPVWYRWGEQEEEWVKRSKVIRWRPANPPSTIRKHDPFSMPSTTDHEPEWVQFFREREAKYRHIMAMETPVEHQRRENRQRDKGVRKAAVFEWLESDNVPPRWERIPVTQQCKIDTLSMYHCHQIRYDAYFSEWDCCERFTLGNPDPGSDDDSDWDVEHENQSSTNLPTSPFSQGAYVLEDPPLPLFCPAAPSEDPCAPINPVQLEVEEVFSKYYGFCAPVISTNLTDITICDRSADWFRRLVGLVKDDFGNDEYFSSFHYQAAQLFLDSVVRIKPAAPSLSDLDDSSLRPVCFLPRFKHLRRLNLRDRDGMADCLDNGDELYMFALPNSTVPWKLATFSPITALLICRLPDDFTETSIAFYLVQRGISFRLMFPPPRLRKHLRRPVVYALPIRKFDHVFTNEDYDSYINCRTQLLGQPQMQSALKRGGISWRLAMGTLGISNIICEPTMWGRTFRPSDELMEDTLATVELDLLCGAYRCVSVRYYEKPECGENHGHWSMERERWYRERLMQIESSEGDAQPLTYTQWKSKQHGVKGIRNFLDHISKASASLIAGHAQIFTSQ